MHSAFRWGLAALLCLAAALPALAETFPARPITLVVPQGPGSGSDVTARLLAAHLGPELGQTVVVENRAGGSGVLAHQSVMRAPADGHTLLLGAGIPICEHMRGLELLPDAGFRFTAAPPKIKAFGTFPVRAFAEVG